MKGKFLVAFVLLALSAASSAMATSVAWNVLTDATSTTYTYTFTSTEFGDKIMEFDVYAQLDPSEITSWSADNFWSFYYAPCDIPGATNLTDYFWYANDPAGADGLAYNASMSVSFSVDKSLGTQLNYTLPGTLGNWSYDTLAYPYPDLVVGTPSVPTPTDAAPNTPITPEPASLLVLAAGLVGLFSQRRK